MLLKTIEKIIKINIKLKNYIRILNTKHYCYDQINKSSVWIILYLVYIVSLLKYTLQNVYFCINNKIRPLNSKFAVVFTYFSSLPLVLLHSVLNLICFFIFLLFLKIPQLSWLFQLIFSNTDAY